MNCSGTTWCYEQWGAPDGEDTHGPGAICGANDTWAWDANLNAPSWDADSGREVFAVATGTVAEVYGGNCDSVDTDLEGYGQVLIRHQDPGGNHWWSAYLHMTDIQVTEGASVTSNTVLGYISNTSPGCTVKTPECANHLHFVVYGGNNAKGGLASADAVIVPRVAQTLITAVAAAGATFLEVADQVGFAVGDTIRINPGGPNEEDKTVTAVGSLVLESPLQFDHDIGEPVVNITPSGAVGGIAELPRADAVPVESGGSPGLDAGVLAGIAAGSTIVAIAVCGGAWYARRRLIG